MNGGYGLKEWPEDAEDSQSTIPDHDGDPSNSDVIKTKKRKAAENSHPHHVMEGNPWQYGVDNRR